MPNLNTLIKLMMMTTSDHDGEALNALRIANAILAKANSNWDDLLRKKLHLDATDPFASAPSMAAKSTTHTTRDPAKVLEVEGFFQKLYARGSKLGTFAAFVDDVYKQWRESGYLTQKQFDVIKRAAQRTR
jgi:hypothetical protein